MIKTLSLKKKFGLAELFFAMIAAMTGCAAPGVMTKSFEPDSFMHFTEVKKWDETKNMNNQVFYVNQGETLPLSLSIDSDFMAVKQDHIDLVAKEKLYFLVKMPRDISIAELKRLNTMDAQKLNEMDTAQRKAYMIYVSRNGAQWAPLNNGKALKKVLGFGSGRLGFGMLFSTTKGVGASLNLKTAK
jgi:hypothetical protein